MTAERIELRLGSKSAEERAIAQAIEALEDGHGVTGRFLKERLVRGFAVVLAEAEHIRKQNDPISALNHMADGINAGHFHALRAVMEQLAQADVEAREHRSFARPVSAPAPAQLAVPEPATTSGVAANTPAQNTMSPESPVTVEVPVAAVPSAALPAIVQSAADTTAAVVAPTAQAMEASLAGQERVVASVPPAPSEGPQDVVVAAEVVAATDETVPPPAVPNWGRYKNLAGGGGGS